MPGRNRLAMAARLAGVFGEGGPMTETLWQRLVRGSRRVLQGDAWPRLAGANWPDGIMSAPVTDRLHTKQGRSTGRLILEADGRRLAVYLKRHYRLPRWRGLLAALWPERGWSPALQEWRHLGWARAQGMPVPNAVAAAEFIGPWGRLQSMLAVEELADMLPLNEALPRAAARLDAAAFRRWKRGLVAEVVRITRALHARRHFHKDLYLCHFYIPRACTGEVPCWRGQVHLIDLHRLRHHRWTWRLWQAKDVGQLLYSSDVPGVDARDRLCFWRAYLGPERRGRTGRLLRRLVLMKWRAYQRHNRRRAA